MRGQGRSIFNIAVIFVLFVLTPRFVFAQATGPQRVPIPAVKPKNKLAKPRVDRSTLPPVPIFQDRARELGVTASHIAAPEAHYVLDSMSGGAGVFDCD